VTLSGLMQITKSYKPESSYEPQQTRPCLRCNSRLDFIPELAYTHQPSRLQWCSSKSVPHRTEPSNQLSCKRISSWWDAARRAPAGWPGC